MTNKTIGLMFPVLVATACGCGMPEAPDPPDPPSDALVAEARARAEKSVASIEDARAVLEMIGILPTYDCTVGRNEYVGAALEEIPTKAACATLTTAVIDGTTDEITATFPAEGCDVVGHHVTGVFVVRITGGTDTFGVELDAHDLVVDGRQISALAGYGTCGDETRYWVAADGTVEGEPFTVDAEVGKRDGIPVIGGTTLLITGTATVGSDSVTMTGIEYEIGDFLPKNGTLVIQTAEHRIEVTFDLDSPILGDVTVKIDDYAAVTIPVVG